jgi:hypothetical protein
LPTPDPRKHAPHVHIVGAKEPAQELAVVSVVDSGSGSDAGKEFRRWPEKRCATRVETPDAPTELLFDSTRRRFVLFTQDLYCSQTFDYLSVSHCSGSRKFRNIATWVTLWFQIIKSHPPQRSKWPKLRSRACSAINDGKYS